MNLATLKAFYALFLFYFCKSFISTPFNPNYITINERIIEFGIAYIIFSKYYRTHLKTRINNGYCNS